MATWVTGGLPLLSRQADVVSVTSSTHILPFCPFSIIREWRAAKIATADSAHFELQKSSSETDGWRHGHYVHFFYILWSRPVATYKICESITTNQKSMWAGSLKVSHIQWNTCLFSYFPLFPFQDLRSITHCFFNLGCWSQINTFYTKYSQYLRCHSW